MVGCLVAISHRVQLIGVDCCASICDMTGFDRVSFVITSVVYGDDGIGT